MKKIFAVAMVMFIVSAVAASAVTWKKVARSSSQGDFATTVVSANISHPAGIAVSVKTYPSQATPTYWTVVCSKGFSAASKSGHYKSLGQATKTPIKLPFSNPDSCSVSADGQLSKSGRLYITIWKR